jgi:hypothetical protein
MQKWEGDPVTCSICQHGTVRDYHKQIMGGVSGAVCWFCFLAWYERSMVTDESIRRESMFLRHDEGALQEGVA